ncbi:hypothetical protein BC938DRAFT_470771 [Jimgerdemannia flammicorona]|uniref:Uncharacterized protein n=1 Tax=Jimgerdemannia flammicorona TaxID=994334 RepID=A0A433Q9L1_9FUNG|nr:hypothetical protein BC938DRAFT_470771 [Jimgerdemannia flammicorona]
MSHQEWVSVRYINIELNIMPRANTERDIGIFCNSYLFRILENVVDLHFGELCSRTSRARKRSAIDGSEKDEGCRLDWLFSVSIVVTLLSSVAIYLCSRNSSTPRVVNLGLSCIGVVSLVLQRMPENKSKESTDLLKAKKNLRDMLRSLDRLLPDKGGSSIIDKARMEITLPAFVYASFKYQVMAMSLLDSTWCGLADVGSFTIPRAFSEFHDILASFCTFGL